MNLLDDPFLLPEPWTRDGTCGQTDPDMWFPATGDKPTADRAKRICRETCPVRDMCLEYALRTGQQYGIWAGYSSRSLQRLRRDAA